MIDHVIDFMCRHIGREIRAIHELKTHPEPFAGLLSNQKRAEVRPADRDFHVGDWLLLREYDPDARQYTGRQLFREITHIQTGGRFGLPDGICVLSVG